MTSRSLAALLFLMLALGIAAFGPWRGEAQRAGVEPGGAPGARLAGDALRDAPDGPARAAAEPARVEVPDAQAVRDEAGATRTAPAPAETFTVVVELWGLDLRRERVSSARAELGFRERVDHATAGADVDELRFEGVAAGEYGLRVEVPGYDVPAAQVSARAKDVRGAGEREVEAPRVVRTQVMLWPRARLPVRVRVGTAADDTSSPWARGLGPQGLRVHGNGYDLAATPGDARFVRRVASGFVASRPTAPGTCLQFGEERSEPSGLSFTQEIGPDGRPGALNLPYDLVGWLVLAGPRPASVELRLHGRTVVERPLAPDADEVVFLLRAEELEACLAHLRLRVREAPNAVVSLRAAASSWREAWRPGEAPLDVPYLPPGRYVLEVRDDTRALARTLELTPGLLDLGELALPAAPLVTVRLVDARGEAVKGNVFVAQDVPDAAAWELFRGVESVPVDAGGRALPLPAGKLLVGASSGLYASRDLRLHGARSPLVRVDAARPPAELVLVVEPLVRVGLELSAAPVEGERLELVDALGYVVQRAYVHDGGVRALDVPPGRYTLRRVDADGVERGRAEVRVALDGDVLRAP